MEILQGKGYKVNLSKFVSQAHFNNGLVVTYLDNESKELTFEEVRILFRKDYQAFRYIRDNKSLNVGRVNERLGKDYNQVVDFLPLDQIEKEDWIQPFETVLKELWSIPRKDESMGSPLTDDRHDARRSSSTLRRFEQFYQVGVFLL